MRPLIAIAMLVAAACGGSGPERPKADAAPGQAAPPSPAAPAPPVDPCALLTKAEVEAAVGRATLDPRNEQAGDFASCNWGDLKDPAAVAGAIASPLVSVSVTIASDPAAAKGILDISRSNAASVEAVGELGDGAYWDKILRKLNAAKGRYQLDVSVAPDAGGLDTAKALAHKAVARLP